MDFTRPLPVSERIARLLPLIAVLILAPVSFAGLGFPTGLGTMPLPDLTMQALGKIPSVVTVGGAPRTSSGCCAQAAVVTPASSNRPARKLL